MVVLTSSVADRDMIKAGVLQAHYVNKPVMLQELLNVLHETGEFFATMAKPRRRGKAKA